MIILYQNIDIKILPGLVVCQYFDFLIFFKTGFKLLLSSRLLISHFSEIILKGHFVAFKVLRDDSWGHHCLTGFKIQFLVTIVHFDMANMYLCFMCCNRLLLRALYCWFLCFR